MLSTLRIELLSLRENFSDRFYATIHIARLLSWRTTPRPFPLFGSAPTTTGFPFSSGFSLTFIEAKKLSMSREGHFAARCCLYEYCAGALKQYLVKKLKGMRKLGESIQGIHKTAFLLNGNIMTSHNGKQTYLKSVHLLQLLQYTICKTGTDNT